MTDSCKGYPTSGRSANPIDALDTESTEAAAAQSFGAPSGERDPDRAGSFAQPSQAESQGAPAPGDVAALLAFLDAHPGATRDALRAAGHTDECLDAAQEPGARLVSRSWGGMFWRYYLSFFGRRALAGGAR